MHTVLALYLVLYLDTTLQQTFCVIVIYVYVHGMTLNLIDFINPILSDQFGLGVEDISYYMLGIMVVWISSSILL